MRHGEVLKILLKRCLHLILLGLDEVIDFGLGDGVIKFLVDEGKGGDQMGVGEHIAQRLLV